jgi:hypothetical protein
MFTRGREEGERDLAPVGVTAQHGTSRAARQLEEPRIMREGDGGCASSRP